MSNRDTEKVLHFLKKEYPKAKTALSFTNPMEILVATMLSAQCTDVQVNRVTQTLFKKYKTIKEYAHADVKSFEQDIRSTGFYRNKTRNIIAAAKKIMTDFNGKVPNTMETLLQLPGVARKTANIVLFNAFNKIEGIAVDTHVRRLSERLGLSKNEDPVKIEQDLMKLVPRKDWGEVSYWIIEHGRNVCTARQPKCPKCVVKMLCPSFKKLCPKGK